MSTDPVAVLAERVRPTCRGAVDALQVAAVLESDGVTDRAAAEEYGYPDVFALAEEVFSRMPPRSPDEEVRRPRPRAFRELSHGVVYVLPSAAFPAAYGLLGLRGLVTGLVLATALGWVWSMGNTVLAYRLIGGHHRAAAARVLRLGMPLGVVVGAAAGYGLTRLLGVSSGVIVLVMAQLGFQLAAGVLLFFRLEKALLLVMLPTVALGVAYLGWGVPTAEWVAGSGIASVTAAGAVAYLAALRPDALHSGVAGAPTPPPELPPPSLPRELAAVLPVMGYAALCAGYLLFADTRYVTAGVDLSLAVAPLVLGMGALEWQARHFSESAVALTRRCRYPAEFVGGVWRLLVRSTGVVLGVLALLALALMLALNQAGLLTGRGLVLIAGHVVLGGAYFIGFLLLNQGRLPQLLAVTAAVLAGHIVATLAPLPYSHGVIFLVSSAVLLTLLLATLSTGLAEVRRYRW